MIIGSGTNHLGPASHFAPALLFFVILPQGCQRNFIKNYAGSKSIYKPGFLPLIRYLALPSLCSVAPAFYERLLNVFPFITTYSNKTLGIYRTGSSSNSVPSSVSINAFLETIKSIILENAIDRIRLLIYNAFRNVYRREK